MVTTREELNEWRRGTAEKIAQGIGEVVQAMGISATVELNTYSVVVHLPPVTFHKHGPCNNLYCRISLGSGCIGQYHIALRQGSVRSALHPHCDSSNGEFCWSDQDKIIEALEKGNWRAALMEMIHVTLTYRPSSAFRRPTGSIPCKIDGCKNLGTIRTDIRTDNGDYLHYVCNAHNVKCEKCGTIAYTLEPGTTMERLEDRNGRIHYVCSGCSTAKCRLCNSELHFLDSINQNTAFMTPHSEHPKIDPRGGYCNNCVVVCASCHNRFVKNESLGKWMPEFASGNTAWCSSCATLATIGSPIIDTVIRYRDDRFPEAWTTTSSNTQTVVAEVIGSSGEPIRIRGTVSFVSNGND